jgi:hypothetical protein
VKNYVREQLCSRFCFFYKPLKDEKEVCEAFIVVERLNAQGSISFELAPESTDLSTKHALFSVLCPSCPFFYEDCDFAAGEDSPPCGGFVFLSIALKKGLIDIDKLTDDG